ncbi:MAG TPA: ABC transporter ATP-binding protein [Phycisphaerae bacterium]|nr:ABC transporter ATP-binding protein [Phycisphaerae bacterium]HUT58559.1 ABC transporter ATP-binding protein [Phycisphaerae bacterium]
MSDPIIQVEHLSKRYHIGARERYRTLRDAVVDAFAAPLRRLRSFGRSSHRSAETIWALKDVSFQVHRGDVLGIIGPNGAGKSTLLKILSRITEPTEGRAVLYGRTGSLLEVGTGFHPELTGRENIFLSGAILGMTRREIRARFDEIVDFSGVEKFLDTPVKRYSSGMHVRLGFAVAAHMRPEILLVDEVLAVGDAEFQKRCLGKMQEVSEGGRTVLFVSHNMAAVARLCGKALLLTGGTCRHWDDVSGAIAHYLRSGGGGVASYADLRDAPGWQPKRQVVLTSVSTHRLDGREACGFNTGDGMLIRVGFCLDEWIPAYCQVNFMDSMGQRVMSVRSTHAGPPLELSGDGCIECVVPDIRLAGGEYSLMLEIGREFPHAEWLDCVPDAIRLRVALGDYLRGFELARGQGVLAQRSSWSVLAATSTPIRAEGTHGLREPHTEYGRLVG